MKLTIFMFFSCIFYFFFFKNDICRVVLKVGTKKTLKQKGRLPKLRFRRAS